MDSAKEGGSGSLSPVLGRLVGRWAEQGIRAEGGVGEREVREFESRHGARLPDELRAYFLAVGGIAVDGETPALDQDLIRFWPLGEVSTLAQAWVPAPDAERWLVIADYAMWTWAYVVQMTTGEVAVSFGGAELRPVARSFDEFLTKYLARDPLVISPDL